MKIHKKGLKLGRKLFIFSILLILIFLILYINKPTLFWNTFQSKRAEFSFKYPQGWNVSQCSKRMVYQFEDQIEHLDFAENCIPNARNDSFGYIIVKKISPFLDAETYLNNYYSSWDYELTDIKNNIVYELKPKPRDPSIKGGQFTSTHSLFLIIKPPLVYSFGITNPSYGYRNNKDENLAVFQNILSTFQISD